jgi:Ca2+-binding EF-hand superfamily protein
MEQMIDMMFRNMDTNHDGVISESEWMAFQEKQFRHLDRKGRGYITKDDVRADMKERMRAQQQQRAMPPQ